MSKELEKIESILQDLKDLESKSMSWTQVRGHEHEIPFSKVCIYDGGNTFWAWLIKIEITSGRTQLFWDIKTPDNYPNCEPTHWMKIIEP